ncbi:hypothetical protein [Endozoicomonas sp. SESOKO2]|uniref:hypothetical protein n=1 Tax=Endozoicomonas sp. SESOKO2 TaxID=2828743 RepID=UPI00214993AD|nr:hypothetical protein [Endozoicomonas sp. SESOKO2]
MLLINKKSYLKTAILFLFVFTSGVSTGNAQSFDLEEITKKFGKSGIHIEVSTFTSTSSTVTKSKSVNGKLKRHQQIKSNSCNGKIISTVDKPKSLTANEFYAETGLLTISSGIKSGSNEIKISFFDPDTGQSLMLTLFNQPQYFQITQAMVSNKKKSTNNIISVNKAASAIDGKVNLHWSFKGPSKRFSVYVGKTLLASFNTPNFPVKEIFIDNGREMLIAELQAASGQHCKLPGAMGHVEAFSKNFIH